MKFDLNSTNVKIDKIKSPSTRVTRKLAVTGYRVLLLCFLAFIIIGSFAVFGVLKGLIETAPSIEDINVIPNGYPTTIYTSAGKVSQTLVGKDANRIYVTLDKIPEDVRDAFVAIEDSRFWTHKGIDVYGIIRAFVNGVTGSNGFSEGASTLTQQLLKNQVFEGGEETTFVDKVRRKIQEQYLAVQLESRLSKEQILEYYLNTINLGQNSLGVEAASKRYFDKSVSKLTISEAAVLAGITQNPSLYNPITNPDANKEKRAIVLTYMKDQGYISEAEYETAIKDNVYERIQVVNSKTEKTAKTVSSYFSDALFDQVLNDLKEDLGYTETQAYNALYRGGLKIYSTQDQQIQKICDSYINDSKNYPSDSKWQLSYQLSIMDTAGKETHYNEMTMQSYFKGRDSSFSIYYTDKKKANSYIKTYKKSLLKSGYKITGENKSFVIQPQASFVLMNQATGQVMALAGGRGNKTGNRTLNRATNSLRQPGSTFKVLSTYLPALDTSGMTLATTQNDVTYYYPGTKKEVKNWDGIHHGISTLRQGIYNSMNVVTVKTFEQVGPKTGYDYLLNLGFTSLVNKMTTDDGTVYTDIQLPTALGGLTKGVSNLELTAGFATVANDGIYTEPSFYTKILDKDGNVLLDKTPVTRQVMKDSTAWLLTSAMEDVVNIGTGKLAKFDSIDMPLAGKTGTTTKDIDLWFVGYTPYYTAGIWGGYDQNEDQVNTTYHKILWRKIMQKVHQVKKLKSKAFVKPSTITKVSICPKCGKLANGWGREEYFALGTEPTETCTCNSNSAATETKK